MISCASCGTDYEDDALYCNRCGLDLVARPDPAEVAPDARDKLRKARRTTVFVHLGVAVVYLLWVLFFGLMLYGVGGEDASLYLWILLPAIPLGAHVLAAVGLANNRRWARPLSIVLGILLLAGFPIGTLCGAVILYQMLRKEWQAAPLPLN